MSFAARARRLITRINFVIKSSLGNNRARHERESTSAIPSHDEIIKDQLQRVLSVHRSELKRSWQ